MSDRATKIIIALALVGGIASSYALATLGEPQSLWLWRDIFGVLP
jgi:hypothetical protein